MKKFILIFAATLFCTFSLMIFILKSTKTIDTSYDYFIETSDSVITKLSFSSSSRMEIYKNGEYGFTSRTRKTIKSKGDSVFIEETNILTDRYGKSNFRDKLYFLCTYDKNGILNKNQLLKSYNDLNLSEDSIVCNKVTIIKDGSVSLY